MKRKASASYKKPPAKKTKTDHQKVLQLQRQLNSLNRKSEIHVFDRGFNGAFTSTLLGASFPSVVLALSTPVQGDSIFNRHGSEISVKRLKLKFNTFFSVNEVDQTRIRVIVYMDRQANSQVNPVVFRSAGGSDNAIYDDTTITDVTVMPFNILQKRRYKILMDKVIVNNPQVVRDYDPASGNTSTVSSKVSHHTFSKALTEKILFASSNLGTSADVVNNNIIFLAISNTPFTVGSVPTMTFNSRMYFEE